MTDRCKDFQDVIENFINEYMMKELLYEGGFVIDETEDNFVKLKFREIDIDSMLKVQNHAIFKYEHHAVTETEMREEISRDPIDESQRDGMYFEMVQKPNAIIESRDEPYTPEAKAASKNIGSKETNNKQKPQNQHGTKPAKTAQKKDEAILSADMDHLWYVTKADIIDMLVDSDDWKGLTPKRLETILNLTFEDMLSKAATKKVNVKVFENGVKSLLGNLSDLLCSHVPLVVSKGEVPYKVSGVFESLRFKMLDVVSKSAIKEEITDENS